MHEQRIGFGIGAVALAALAVAAVLAAPADHQPRAGTALPTPVEVETTSPPPREPRQVADGVYTATELPLPAYNIEQVAGLVRETRTWLAPQFSVVISDDAPAGVFPTPFADVVQVSPEDFVSGSRTRGVLLAFAGLADIAFGRNMSADRAYEARLEQAYEGLTDFARGALLLTDVDPGFPTIEHLYVSALTMAKYHPVEFTEGVDRLRPGSRRAVVRFMDAVVDSFGPHRKALLLAVPAALVRG